MDKEYFELLSELRNDLISVGEIIDLEKISINVDRYIEMFFLKNMKKCEKNTLHMRRVFLRSFQR